MQSSKLGNFFQEVGGDVAAKDPPIQELIELGVVPLLVSFLVFRTTPEHQPSHRALQFEAAWALTNIASGNSTQTEVVIESGAIPHLIRLVRSNNPDVKEQAVWALGNIAGDSTTNRDLILTSGAVPELTEILYNQAFRISTLRIAVWAISNLCRGKKPIARLATAIANLVYSMDEDILIDTCWTLAYMASGPNERIQCVIEARVIPRLIQLLEHDSADVKTPALRAIGSIVTGDDLQTQMVIDSGVLPGLARLLLVPTADYTKDACWVISNITAGTIDQIDAVVNANVMVPLIEVLRKGDFRTKREACWAVCNATMGWLQKPEHVRYLVQQGVIKPLCDLLRVNDAKVAKIVLEALENILRVGEMDRRITGGENEYAEHIDAAGGMDQINKLQSHSNIDIYQKCFNIIEKYYGEDAEDRLSEPVLSASGMYDFKTEIAAGEHFSF
ncbi:armadillo-type protein [Zopfochytrium polystomum]|nr:armadillo-type protein [Zopfochytrium polystomum]